MRVEEAGKKASDLLQRDSPSAYSSDSPQASAGPDAAPMTRCAAACWLPGCMHVVRAQSACRGQSRVTEQTEHCRRCQACRLLPRLRRRGHREGSTPSKPGHREGSAVPSEARAAELLRLGFLMAITMTLHNAPEGFAVRTACCRTDR